MAVKYNIEFSLNLSNVFPEVESVMNTVNAHLAKDGYAERISVRGRPIKMALTVERELTEQEIDKMKDLIQGQLCEKFAGSNPVCESFRRQSGNVLQSAS